MADLEFSWHPAKAASNLRRHGVSFEEARTAFEDEHGLVLDDPDHSETEDRFILLGVSARTRLLVVIHCYRSSANTIRIISARKATRSEQKAYRERGTL